MGPPANYPDFRGLARRIASSTGFKQEKYEPFDHFLGRLENAKIKVHEQAKTLLTNPKSKPNPLHNHIMRLFTSESVRIVTTNFDNHFTTALNAKFDPPPEVFKAPALPVGGRFTGLVYLHGSVEGSADRLVLTDRDFGHAYLTEGWARRFLQELYSTFTVLFVGYSHNDPVMIYLTRGLPPNSTRLFAFAPEDAADHWKFLGITPIPYSMGSGGHAALERTFERWADKSSWGALDHERQIKALVQGAPPLVGSEEDDYMRSVLEDLVLVRFFVRHAKRAEWLDWAEDRGFLRPLFSRAQPSEERLWHLADWFSRNFVLGFSEKALAVYERQGQRMCSSLWLAIAQNLHGANSVGGEILSRWIPLLVGNYSPGDNCDLLAYLLPKLAEANEWSTFITLFDFLARPRVGLEKRYNIFASKLKDERLTSSKIIILGSHYWLNETWQKYLKPKLPELALRIARIASGNIQHAHDLALSHRVAYDDWEPLSFHRSAIEPHEQNHLNHDFDVVIDAARDSLEWLLGNDTNHGGALIEEWISTESQLLRRLAVHGMTEAKYVSENKKIDWIIKRGLLESVSLHHELYRLLWHAYPKAEKQIRRALLDEARIVVSQEIKSNPGKDPNMYWHELYRLLCWLDLATGQKCPLVRSRLRRLSRKYPKWVRPEKPDFTHWSSGGRLGNESPIIWEDLLKKPPSGLINTLLTYKRNEFRGPNRDGLLVAVSDAVKNEPNWGLSLAKELKRLRQFSSDLWPRILWGLSEATLSKAQWKAILSLIGKNPQLFKHDAEIALVLQKSLKKDQGSIPYSLLPQAEAIAGRLFTMVDRRPLKSKEDSRDWLQAAINDTGGHIAEFFLDALSLHRKANPKERKTVPFPIRKVFQRMTMGGSQAAEMGRILLASQLHFLFYIDPKWTRKSILPLFSWAKNKRAAKQAWHGYLIWGRWLDDTLRTLLPLYAQCFDKLKAELKDFRERFAEHVADICILSGYTPTTGKWLNQFLRKVEPIDRKHLASGIGRTLWNSDKASNKRVWQTWLGTYWSNRLLGKPVPLESQELSAMISWAPHLEEVFPEVVEQMTKAKIRVSVDDFIYHLILEKKIADQYPVATAKLMLHLAQFSDEPVYDFGNTPKMLEKLVDIPETHGILAKVADKLAAKGSAMASKIKEQIEVKKKALAS
ncbi:MAG: DUF4020 domain-containing protein [bacterium]